MNKKLIALDDGHGIATAGKRTPSILELGGRVIHENEFNRAVVSFLSIDLKRCGFDTLLVAPGDVDVSLDARVNLANLKKADAYISIHFDALDGIFNGNDPEGLSVHVYPGSTKSKKLGESILKYLKTGTVQQNRGVRETNLYVLHHTKMAAILSENGFMDNKREAMLMINVDFQKEVAKEHAQGICNYFGVKYIAPIVKPVVVAPVVKPILKADVIYRVVSGSFADKENAAARVEELKKAGVESFIVIK